MAATAKYQVFISSTFEDLKEERDQVIKAVLEMGHIPVGMEMFSAADNEQWQIIAKHIEESDYYAVIAAHRLGSLTHEGTSYTRKEYEYALKLGIPALGFVINEKAPWPSDRIDKDSVKQTELQAFKALIQEKPVGYWSTADELYAKFSLALMKAITANPREGWIRASSAGAGPEVTAELSRLSAENADLRSRLEISEGAAEREELEQLQSTLHILMDTERKPSYRYTGASDWHIAEDCSLFSIFLRLAPEMMAEASTEDMSRLLAMDIRGDTSRDPDIVAYNQFNELMADFMTLDLVNPSEREHAPSDVKNYWILTPFGIRMLKAIRRTTLAMKKENAPEDSEQKTQSTPHEKEPFLS
ncbi:DUF4062 domain-containing protein [Paenarthrobacter histidinolovorans]|uniref:DUF4062 domain-containing protein n=1 Tax=Paenarthrobacter histidinolovorans TaxID=43664 RepID=UPI00166300D3|nr:DUF4062 domain-containing protein [Paenarthrobacter histidinolovorans]GGJ40638.1 hypothetical protein GCM10010052_42180 [Paenarthrobacter histidinolovorans]